MIPAPFDYARAESVDHAIDLLSQRDDAKILAGGHSLLPLMKLRLARPSLLVDISRIRELRAIRSEGDDIAIGALARHCDVAASDLLRRECPVVAFAAGEIGDPQVRHAGTIGGAAAHADPASDVPAVLLALDATMVVRGAGGSTRRVDAATFFRGLFEADIAANEVLAEIRVPRTRGRGWSYLKFHRRSQDWAVVGVAAVARAGGGASIALANMGDRPLRAASVERSLEAGAAPAEAAALAADGTAPPSDAAASSEYRRELAKVLVRRALAEALIE